ncbi:MAG: ATP-binding protein [Gammaproteobacteria bacterium GWE2_42_36]|nr:MAG: ATP-binding protein [Gammaproteobacteria bacterium GWE2_42_36]
MNKVLMSWSTGKDSAYTLYKLKQSKNEFEVVGLFTTLTMPFDRTSIHGVRRKLLEAQAKQINLPLCVLEIPYPCSNEQYESLMKNFLTTEVLRAGISYIAFGDLFLEDIRHYRETKLSSTSIQPLFPLWQQHTSSLAVEMIDQGFKAIITCIDPKKLDISFVGRKFDKDFIQDLPSDIDPCGENGEFHTFVYDAPLFANPIPVSIGKIVERDGSTFADLIFKE